MATDLAARGPGWTALLSAQERRHPPAALGLGVALAGVLALLLQSLVQVAGGNAAPGLRLALLGSMAAFAATALGSLPALVAAEGGRQSRRAVAHAGGYERHRPSPRSRTPPAERRRQRRRASRLSGHSGRG
jgi:hypothetical protein